jgi:hypothetical protein
MLAGASKEYKERGHVLVAFDLDVDGYHWKAVYVKADRPEKTLEASIFGSKYP